MSTQPQDASILRLVDGLIATVLAAYAAIYLYFWLAFTVGHIASIGDFMKTLPPVLMALSAFYGLYQTWRLAKDPDAKGGLLAPISLIGTAAVFIWIWSSGAMSGTPSGFALVLLPGLLAAWTGGRLTKRWLDGRRA